MNCPTQEELGKMWDKAFFGIEEGRQHVEEFARSIIDWRDAQAAKQEPVYQLKSGDGKWIDQAKHSYEYNAANGHEVRKLYAATMPAQAPGVIDYCFIKEVSDKYGLDYNKFCAAYRAMLAAAPTPPLPLKTQSDWNKYVRAAAEIGKRMEEGK